MEDKVTIIIPVFNVENYLSRCVISTIDQTFSDIEIVLVDDGSYDNSAMLCDYFLNYDRIIVVHKRNGGLSSARNTALLLATGKYYFFLDSDDYIEQNTIESLVCSIRELSTDLVVARAVAETEEGKPIAFSPREETCCIDRNEYFTRMVFHPLPKYIISWGKLYRATLWENVRFPEGKIHEDEFVIHEIIDRCGTIAFSSDVFYHYVVRTGSIMHSSFSVRSLDGVEAILRRAEFFLKSKKITLASRTVAMGGGRLLACRRAAGNHYIEMRSAFAQQKETLLKLFLKVGIFKFKMKDQLIILFAIIM